MLCSTAIYLFMLCSAAIYLSMLCSAAIYISMLCSAAIREKDPSLLSEAKSEDALNQVQTQTDTQTLLPTDLYS